MEFFSFNAHFYLLLFPSATDMCHKDVHTQLPGNGLGHKAPGHHPWGQEGESAAHAERLRPVREARQPGEEGPLWEQCLHQRQELVCRQGVAQTASALQP